MGLHAPQNIQIKFLEMYDISSHKQNPQSKSPQAIDEHKHIETPQIQILHSIKHKQSP